MLEKNSTKASFGFIDKDANTSMMDKYNLSRLLNFLHEKTRIHYDVYRANFVEKRLHSRMLRLKITDYGSYLQYLNNYPQEIQKFVQAFTINVSNFFRNPEVFNRVQELIYTIMEQTGCIDPLNRLRATSIQHASSMLAQNGHDLFQNLEKLSLYRKIKQRRSSLLNLWSCACAGGQEPYSIAMMLDQITRTNPDFIKYRIIASDIDKEAIEEALAGVYSEDSMKEMGQLYKLTYFSKFKGQFGFKYTISDDIKNQVTFLNEDVIKGHKMQERYDIIFCRYMFIYIERIQRDRILDVFFNHLNDGGLLVVGKTETLFNTYEALKLIDSRNHIYIKQV